MKRFLIVLALALALAAPAQATTIVEPPGSHFPYQQWADESKMPTPEITLEVIETSAEAACPGRPNLDPVACTQPREHKIWMSPERVMHFFPRGTFYHELGHNVDYFALPEWMRLRFMAILEMEDPWYVDVEEVDYWTPSEKFAMVYAECATKPVIRRRDNLLGVGPIFQHEPVGGRQRHNQLCRMLAKL